MEDSKPDKDPSDEGLPTIWNVPDELWMMVQALLHDLDPPKPTGRKRIDARRALDGMIYRARTGCQWNHLPSEFGDDSSVHRTAQRWHRVGLWDQLWALLQDSCEELGGVDWQWQAADGMMGKARGVPREGGSAGDRAKPHRPREGRHQEEPAGGAHGRSAGRGDRRRQRP